MSGGFIRVERSTFDHPVLADDPLRVAAWIGMVAQASWKPTRVMFRGHWFDLKRGQLATTVRDLAARYGMSKSSMQRFLDDLKSGDMIRTELGHGRLVINVCNYDKYQTAPERSGTDLGQTDADSWDIEQQTNNSPKGETASPTPEKQVFDLGKRVLGPKAGGVITQLRKALNYDDAKALTILGDAKGKSSPMEWVRGVIRTQDARAVSPADNLQFAERSQNLLAAGYTATQLGEMDVRGMSEADYLAKLNATQRAA